MAEGMFTTAVNDMLDALFQGTKSLQLHTGNPGVNGTSNQTHAKHNITFGAASSGTSSQTGNTDITMSSTVTVTDISIWDGSDFLASIDLASSRSYVSGDICRINGVQVWLDSPYAS